MAGLTRYPVKSFQGVAVERIEIDASSVVGDRRFAVVVADSGNLLSAKIEPTLLLASVREGTDPVADAPVLVLPDGTEIAADATEVGPRLSTWLGRDVQLRQRQDTDERAYEMTFDPPNDDAELFAIPAPRGHFVDLAAVHLLTTATLAHVRATHPDLDWDVRRFRPNILLDIPGADPFVEDTWVGGALRVGEAVLGIDQPTVRCAMPLRAQPGLDRQRDLYAALDSVHANHLGVYASVRRPGAVALGDSAVPLRP